MLALHSLATYANGTFVVFWFLGVVSWLGLAGAKLLAWLGILDDVP
jgi:hypothetical protein